LSLSTYSARLAISLLPEAELMQSHHALTDITSRNNGYRISGILLVVGIALVVILDFASLSINSNRFTVLALTYVTVDVQFKPNFDRIMFKLFLNSGPTDIDYAYMALKSKHKSISNSQISLPI